MTDLVGKEFCKIELQCHILAMSCWLKHLLRIQNGLKTKSIVKIELKCHILSMSDWLRHRLKIQNGLKTYFRNKVEQHLLFPSANILMELLFKLHTNLKIFCTPFDSFEVSSATPNDAFLLCKLPAWEATSGEHSFIGGSKPPATNSFLPCW